MQEITIVAALNRRKVMECLRDCMGWGEEGQYVNEDDFRIIRHYTWGPNDLLPGTAVYTGVLTSATASTVITCNVQTSVMDRVWYVVTACLILLALTGTNTGISWACFFGSLSIILSILQKHQGAMECFEKTLKYNLRCREEGRW